VRFYRRRPARVGGRVAELFRPRPGSRLNSPGLEARKTTPITTAFPSRRRRGPSGPVTLRAALALAVLGACAARAAECDAPPPFACAGARIELVQGAGTAPERAPPPAVKSTAYEDKLIEGALPEEELEAREALEPQPLGVRSFVAEYGAQAQRLNLLGGTSYDQGLRLAYRQETLEYGELFVDGMLRRYDRAPGEPETDFNQPWGGRLTLFQTGLALTERARADNALGVVRVLPSALIGSSYRFPLPSSLAVGGTAVVSSAEREFRVMGGGLGRIDGFSGQAFTRVPGQLSGIGYLERFGERLQLGGQAYSVRGAQFMPDHDTYALAAAYARSLTGRYKVQWLHDSLGHNGGWLEGDEVALGLRHRFGVYRFEPGLLWTDVQIANDQQGGYWRGDYRSLALTVSGGLEVNQSNIDDDPMRAGNLSRLGYATVNYRVDRATSVGGSLSLQSLSPRGLTPESNQIYAATAFLAYRSDFGISRIDLQRGESNPEISQGDEVTSVALNQDWTTFAPLAVSTQLAQAWETRQGTRQNRTTLGASVQGPLALRLTGFANAVAVRIDGPTGAETDFNVNAGLNWALSRRWSLFGQVAVNTVDPSPPLPGQQALPFMRDTRVLFGIRYEETRGTPIATVGVAPGQGTGRLVGQVFFDENGDGRRQPNELGAPNITVYLDGRFPAQTDAEGRFAFPLVTAGTHALRIQNERLPLPWTLDDATPTSVTVPVRGEAVLDIPLTRLRQ
jgi:hypothetical protein